MTCKEFYNKYDLSANIPLTRWINKEKMTEEEKKTVIGWETTGGYLKTLEFKEACQIWWEENPNEHEKFLSLPNFDWSIFTSITGIKPKTKIQEIIELNGIKYKKI